MQVSHAFASNVSETEVIHIHSSMTLKELAQLALKYDKRVHHERDKLQLRPTLIPAYDTTRPSPIRDLSGDATTD